MINDIFLLYLGKDSNAIYGQSKQLKYVNLAGIEDCLKRGTRKKKITQCTFTSTQ